MLSRFFSKIKRIWSIPTLRDRIFYTLAMFLIIRAGTHIPLPGVDLFKLKSMTRGGIVDFINLVSGGAFSRASIFTLSIMPYINASIIFYVLTLAYPKLEEMQRAGGKEKAKITQWTRYLTIAISVVHSIFTVIFLQSRGLIEIPGMLFMVNTIFLLTSSVTFLTWIGDRITANGIGNGISSIIFLGIVSRIPSSVIRLVRSSSAFNIMVVELIGVSLITFILILAIISFQTAIRSLPVVYASGRGRSVATKSTLPMRINNAGVMPIIFANVVASFPSILVGFLPDSISWKSTVASYLVPSHYFYQILYFFMVLFFTFFYTSVIFNPEKISENLKRSGASIPGVRPGQETSNHLERIITRITFAGALFLAMIAVLPYILSLMFGQSFSIGGTGIIIAVGVAIETIQQIEGALSMENYQNFI